MTPRGTLSVVCMAIGICLPWQLAWGISSMVVFGDSLSDVGNVYNNSFHLAPSSPPYYQGRYSNGPLWAEDLATDQGLTVPTRSTGSGSDWAYAGTTTGTGYTTFDGIFNFPNIETQVGSFLSGHTPTSDQLFVLWGGGNDFINGQTNVSIPVSNISASITTLASKGAKTFLIPNLPPLGETPRFHGTSNQTTMDNLSSQFNSQLATTLTSLQSSLNVTIYQLNVSGIFQNILASPSNYGFTDVTDSALVGSTVVPNPNQYLFWDDIHPTQVGHNLLGSAASDLLDTHNWIASAPSASWTSTTSWNPSAAPQSRWITNVVNSTSPNTREAVVSASSSVRSVSVSGTSGLMSLRIDPGAVLSASQSISASSGGQIHLNGGQITTPLVHLTGNASLIGSGTIAGNFTQDSTSSMGLSLAGTGAGQFEHISITGAASLSGAVDISLNSGYVSLPGSSYQILNFASLSGSPSIINQTGYAGLQFLTSSTPTALTITATALSGDANLDGVVNVADLFAEARLYNTSGDLWTDGDFNHDGIVDINDLRLLAQDWGQAIGSPMGAPALGPLLTSLGLPDIPVIPVPEPSAVAVISLAAFALRRRHRVLSR